ncbi:uncharacterized protein LOC133737598 [Rosa rugosa]|uniref:uncharacterized protein LOC133737598 n=1 Tax=Rosa rugosa TaxID=74645 RepID=UPI002B400469|nr:uncharacterized protein LOC133737598 [Rosa rugosa]
MQTRGFGSNNLVPLDREIERTARSHRKRASQRVGEQDKTDSFVFPPIPPHSLVPPSPIELQQAVITPLPVGVVHSDSEESFKSSEAEEEEQLVNMAGNRTLKQLTAPTAVQQPLCIAYPAGAQGFELKSGILHHLPKFHGFSTEDPNLHLKEFHMIITGMKPEAVLEEHAKLRAFPFSLEGKAREWLYNQSPGSMNSWDQVQQAFLEEYFPATKAASIRKDICAIRQMHGESFGEYYDRFNRLISSCPNHQISDHLLIIYFYEGLCGTDRIMLDAASGGAFVDKIPANAHALCKNIASNTRQYGGRDMIPRQNVNEVSSTSNLEAQIANLTNLVKQVVLPKQVCGVCSMMGHAADMCPSLNDQGGWEQANAIGGFQGQQRAKYDPFSNTYNPGWRDHPNFRWNNNDNVLQPQGNNFNRSPPGFQQARQQASYQAPP